MILKITLLELGCANRNENKPSKSMNSRTYKICFSAASFCGGFIMSKTLAELMLEPPRSGTVGGFVCRQSLYLESSLP